MIKLFETFNEYSQIKDWLDRMDIEDYTINDDLTVDVEGNVVITHYNLYNIPVQFGRVEGYFLCDQNKLTSLKGCPNYVTDTFSCSVNNLTSLEGCPEYIGANFYCANNKLTSLQYSPQEIGGILFIISNNILPKEILDFDKKKFIIKYQDDYSIWNADGSFNKGRWDIFLKDFEAGILK